MNAMYDRKANGTLVAFFDEAERRLIERRGWKPDEVTARLASDYVEACGQIHRGGLQYLAIDEWHAADIFLHSLMRELKLVSKFRAPLSKAVSHFVLNASHYLPNLPTVLERRFMEFMAGSPTPNEILFSGIVRQAGATLDRSMVLAVVDRELRRLGVERHIAIVSEIEVNDRTKYLSNYRCDLRYLTE